MLLGLVPWKSAVWGAEGKDAVTRWIFAHLAGDASCSFVPDSDFVFLYADGKK